MHVFERQVLHLDVADFPVAVERVREGALKHRPVAIAPPEGRALVACLSAEARAEGLRVGMPVHEAKRRCPGLKLRTPDPALYSRATRAIHELIQSFSPNIESGVPGRAYLDATGMQGVFGPPVDHAARLRRELENRLRLPVAVGVAVNKLVSRVAADLVEPHGILDVRSGDEATFLEPLLVQRLPGIGSATASKLKALNVRVVRQLALIELEHLTMVFGSFGVTLHQRALGIDPRPILSKKQEPEIRQAHTFGTDCNDPLRLRITWKTLVDQAGHALRATGKAATRITCVVDYSDGKRSKRQLKTTHPLYQSGELREQATELFELTLTRRVRVRRFECVLSGWQHPTAQQALFEPVQVQKDRALSEALDRVKNRYGDSAVGWGDRLYLGAA